MAKRSQRRERPTRSASAGPALERGPVRRSVAVEAVPVGQVTADDLVEEVPATTADAPSSRAAGARSRTRGPSTSFEESAAQEYAYVASDVRRIAVVGGSLFAVLIALWLLIEVLGIIKI